MKISKRVLSVPPYLTTPWENVSSLQLEAENLVVKLIDGTQVSIPNLDSQSVAQVFATYEAHLEEEPEKEEEIGVMPQPFGIPFPFGNGKEMAMPNAGSIRFGIGGMEGLTGLMQHDPNQMQAPAMPQELLEKIAGIARVVAPDDLDSMPKAEPHCNCPHCQISRALRQEPLENAQALETEEEVSVEDLTFREWDIKEVGDKVFSVANPLDSSELYTVSLGKEMGCTCAEENCEHIRHVLMS